MTATIDVNNYNINKHDVMEGRNLMVPHHWIKNYRHLSDVDRGRISTPGIGPELIIQFQVMIPEVISTQATLYGFLSIYLCIYVLIYIWNKNKKSSCIWEDRVGGSR